MNVELLYKVIAYLAEEPRRLDMSIGVCGIDAEDLSFCTVRKDRGYDKDFLPPCGTVCCIAGAATILAGKAGIPEVLEDRLVYRMNWYTTAPDAQEVLDLTDEQANRLFYLSTQSSSAYRWPNDSEKAYFAAKTPQERFEVTKKRIERFIATKGAE